MNRRLLPTLVCTLALVLPACAGDAGEEGAQIGAECEVDEDCEEGLLCDVHDDHSTCQEPHDD